MSAKRKKNVINLITRISVVGIAVITASLVILLSAFNGIEKMVESLYSDYDTAITIRSKNSKTFFENQLPIEKLKKVEGVHLLSKAVEETVVLKHEKKWLNASVLGVEPNFLTMTDMKNHMVDGYPTLKENNQDVGIIGATLLDKLEGYIPQSIGTETIIIYGPKRDMKMRLGKNPFNMRVLPLAGRMNFNREVNEESLVISLGLAQEVLGYDENEISALFATVKTGYDKNDVKENIQKILNNQFVVKTNFEKNALIFQTSKTERMIVLVILAFIFILASFNLVASITMLFVEKKDDIETLRSMGAHRSDLFNIFFYEGLLIAAKGILYGLLFGYGICFAQLQFGLLQMPNSNGEAFPIMLTWTDGFIILFLVSLLSVLASYFPVRMLIKRNLKKE